MKVLHAPMQDVPGFLDFVVGQALRGILLHIAHERPTNHINVVSVGANGLDVVVDRAGQPLVPIPSQVVTDHSQRLKSRLAFLQVCVFGQELQGRQDVAQVDAVDLAKCLLGRRNFVDVVIAHLIDDLA
ncbi:hypothetical protein D3C78_1382300 [compost metagenome]